MGSKEVQRILVIRAGAIGDLILTLPAIGALRKAYPKAHIEVMGYPSRLEFIRNRYYADRVCSINQSGLAPLFVKDGTLPAKLARYFASFDLIVSFCSDQDGVFSDNLRKAGARRVISAKPFPPEKNRRHIIEHLLSPLKAHGIEAEEAKPRIFFTQQDREFAAEFWREHHLGSVIALHPGSGSPKKRWGADRFAQVADWAVTSLGTKILLISGPADGDVAEDVAHRMKSGGPILLKDSPLVELASILERCQCFIGNDSGITHMAAAVGTPTIAIFGPSDPEIWGPRGDRTVILRGKTPCSPCTRDQMKSCQDLKCLDLVKVEQVTRIARIFANYTNSSIVSCIDSKSSGVL